MPFVFCISTLYNGLKVKFSQVWTDMLFPSLHPAGDIARAKHLIKQLIITADDKKMA